MYCNKPGNCTMLGSSKMDSEKRISNRYIYTKYVLIYSSYMDTQQNLWIQHDLKLGTYITDFSHDFSAGLF